MVYVNPQKAYRLKKEFISLLNREFSKYKRFNFIVIREPKIPFNIERFSDYIVTIENNKGLIIAIFKLISYKEDIQLNILKENVITWTLDNITIWENGNVKLGNIDYTKIVKDVVCISRNFCEPCNSHCRHYKSILNLESQGC